MTSFEVQHPRATDGTFATKDQGAPEVSLNGWPVAEAPTRSSIWSDALERGTADRAPVGSAQTAAALRNTRGEADGAVRRVILRADTLGQRSTTRDFDVVGPSDGRPILVDVRGGMFRLKVTSGHAIVRADSGHGNVVTVSDGATATVLVENDRKMSLHAEHGSVVDLSGKVKDQREQHLGSDACDRYAAALL
jgi:hypothetical protein